MANVDQKNLIPLCILEVLRKYSDEDHLLTHNMIADHLVKDYGISPRPERKSIGRNLENLKTQLDIDIDITPKGSYLVSHDFEDYEIRLLIDLVLSNKYISVLETRELVSKLKGLSGIYFKSYEDHLLTIDEKRKTDKRDLYYKLQLINEAISNGHDICFELDKNADYPSWLLTAKCWLKDGITGEEDDYDEEEDRNAQIKPEYLVLLNNRYYVAFKTLVMKGLGVELVEELTYCGLDEMKQIRIVDHETVSLPKSCTLLDTVEVTEDAVREMISRDVLEHPERNMMRFDFLIDPPLERKARATLGEPFLRREETLGLFSKIRMVVDADRETFERFWWQHPTEIWLLGPLFEVNYLKAWIEVARETMDDAEAYKKRMGIRDVVPDTRKERRANKKKKPLAVYPEMKICNQRIFSKECESEAHFYGLGNKTIKDYEMRGELEIEDEGHIVFIHGEYHNDVSLTGKLRLWATTESLYSIEDEYEDIYGDLASKCNHLCEEGVEKYFPGQDPADRYSDMEDHMLKMFRERIEEDQRWDELTKECIEWECLYYNEDRKEPFDIDRLFDGLSLEL